jgi:hypothetical protein
MLYNVCFIYLHSPWMSCYCSEVVAPDGVHNTTQWRMCHLNVHTSDSLSPITFMVFLCFIWGVLQGVTESKNELCDSQIIFCSRLLMEDMREVDGIFWHNRITRSFVRRNPSIGVVSAGQLHFLHSSPLSCKLQIAKNTDLKGRHIRSVNNSVHMSCKNDICDWNKVAK